MIWFIFGALVGWLGTLWWCDRNWRRFRGKADTYDRLLGVCYEQYSSIRVWLRSWGEDGLISRVPEPPPTIQSFRYAWSLVPDHSARSFLGLLECVRSAREQEEVLEHKESRAPLYRRVEYARAIALKGVAEYLPHFERRVDGDHAELPPATNPIQMSSFGDLDEDDDRRSREQNLAEAREQMDKDEPALTRYLRRLLSGELTILSPDEIQNQVAQVRGDLAEIKAARAENRIPDLEDYEMYQDDDLDDDLDDDDDDTEAHRSEDDDE